MEFPGLCVKGEAADNRGEHLPSDAAPSRTQCHPAGGGFCPEIIKHRHVSRGCWSTLGSLPERWRGSRPQGERE
jgi:hypothetical protein